MFARPSRSVAAVLATATVALGLAGIALPTAALAADVACSATPASSQNTGSVTITATATAGAGFYQLNDFIRLAPHAGSSAGVTNIDGPADTNVQDIQTGKVSGLIDLTAAAPGDYDVQVIRKDVTNAETVVSQFCTTGRTTSPIGTFALVSPGAPVVSSISPTTRAQGSAAVSATITGSNFAKGLTVEFLTGSAPDSGITFTPSTVSAGSITGTLTVAPTAAAGAHQVRVTNTDSQAGTSACPGSGCLTVTAQPTITSVSPATVGQGASRTLNVIGTGFANGATATVLNAGTSTADTTVPATAVTYVTASQLLVTVAPSGSAAVGPRDLKITNPDAGAATKANAFSVTAAPTITGVSPASYDQGVTGKTITVTGTGFASGAEASFPAGSGVTVTGTSVDSATQLSVVVDITASAATGAKVLTVTNTDGGSGTSSAFSVTAKPTVTGVSPPSAARGTTATISVSGTSFASDAQVSISGDGIGTVTTTYNSDTSLSATFTISATATQSQRDVTVTNGARGGVGTLANGFAVAAIGVTGVTPSSSGNGPAANAVTLTVAGSGFDTGSPAPTVSLVPVGAPAYQPAIVASSVTVASSSSLTAVFNLVGAAPTGYALKVVNANGDTGSCNSCFQVVGSTPAVTSVNPASRGSGAQSQALQVLGSGFARGATVSFGSGVTLVGQPTFVSTTEIDVVVNVPGGVTASTPVSVTVANVDGANGSCATCFTINAAPAITSLTPASRAAGATGTKSVTLSGSGFQSGATVVISGGDIPVTGISVAGDGNSITFSISTQSAAVGARSVTVSNPDAGTTTKANGFTVNPQPTVTGITPNKGATGTASQSVTITGTGFLSGATVSLGSDIAVSNVVVAGNGQSITATLNLTGAATGPRNLTVTNPDDGAATKSNAYTVVSAPTVTSATPSTAGQGAVARSIMLAGTGFVTGAVVTVSGAGVSAGTATVNSPTSITVPITVDSAAATGARDVTVTNPDTGNGTCTGCLTIAAKPVVTSITPDKVPTGTATQSVTVAGSGFVAGATLSLGSGVAITNVTVTATSITADISTTGATPGPRDVTVTNTDGGRGVLAAGFTVVSKPTITGVTPASLAQGATAATVTITGTNFTAGSGTQPVPTVSFGTGVTVSDVVSTATTITLKATVDVAATTGARTVTVTNPDSGSASDATMFSIDPKVTITSLTPARAQQGSTGVAVTVSGSGFQVGTVQAAFSGTGITVTSANATSSTAVSLVVDVAPTAALGTRTLTITNATNKGSAACTDCFTVLAPRSFAVSIDSASPESGSTHTVTVTAKQGTDPSSPTDTTYTGVPVLTSTDTHFAPGTCAAAVSGVSTCTNVVFGDLGPQVLTAVGQGADSDRGGTVNVVVDAVALEFVSPPTTGTAGQPVSFTVRPTVGVTGATITGYAKARTLTTTGGTTTPASGSVLACSSPSCGFTVTWATGGSKTLSVSDGHATSPVITLTMPQGTTISIALSRRLCVYGDTVVLSGRLLGADGQPGGSQTLGIWARTAPATSLTLVRNVVTGSDGRWSASFRPPRNTVFQARFAGAGSLNASNSSILSLVVRSKVVVTSKPTTVVHGKAFTVKGAVGPAVSGQLVSLQFFGPDHKWHTLASGGKLVQARTASNGTYALFVSKGVGTSYRWYRVYVLNTTTNASGVSSGFLIKAT